MIGHNSEGNKKSTSDFVIAGGLSGALARLVLQPLDVVKTRFQLQVEPISHKHGSSKYRGLFHAVGTIYKEETIFALWKGHVSAQILSILYGITQFALFEEMTRYSDQYLPEKYKQSSGLYFLNGGVASGTATIVSFPFDVTRTRFIAQGVTKEYEKLHEALYNICKKQGFKALYRGMTPTLIQAIPYGGLQFGFYAVFTQVAENCNNFSKSSVTYSLPSSIVAGFLAGVCAKTVVYPFDVCRKRLQAQDFQELRKTFGKTFTCNGMVDCFVKTYQKETVKGLFKGLQPSLIKAAFSTSMYFALYEKILEIITERKK